MKIAEKPWNLVVPVVTLCTFRGEDGKPVSPGFGQIEKIVKHVGQDNVVIVFTGVSDDGKKRYIESWLTVHNFFRLTNLPHKRLVFAVDTDGDDVVPGVLKRFYSKSYSHTVLVSDMWPVIKDQRGDSRHTSLLLLGDDAGFEKIDETDVRSHQFADWDALIASLDDILLKRKS